jgi:hypothetical protein
MEAADYTRAELQSEEKLLEKEFKSSKERLGSGIVCREQRLTESEEELSSALERETRLMEAADFTRAELQSEKKLLEKDFKSSKERLGSGIVCREQRLTESEEELHLGCKIGGSRLWIVPNGYRCHRGLRSQNRWQFSPT